jgi:hypothetical protein
VRKSEEFAKWFDSVFLFSRDPASTILNSDSKTIKAKYARIREVCKRMLDKPNKSIKELRQEIALDFFISMRIALDYINYCELVIKLWKKGQTK